jgi:hypothetical protein
MDPTSNDPGVGVRQDRGSNACSGEQHDRGCTAPPTTVQSTRRIAAHTAPTTSAKPAAPLCIVIVPTPSGRKWTARLGERVLCVSAWPFVKSARLLLAEGYPADAFIEMWRPNSDAWALRGRLGAVAATVIDGETAPRCAKNGVPSRFPGIAVTTPAGGAS